ncbi:MAG: hypothetical protein GYB64_04090, partial [Chloroflexi bacterium]|nr:hypothetical protein [Chloroflexota bacterium]
MLRRTLLILTLILTATAFTQTARAGVTVQSGITKVLDPNGGEHVSMVLDSSGSPVIAYYDPVDSDLEFIHCGDPLCNTMTTRTLASAGLVGMYASIQLDSSDRPRIAYQDSTNNAVKIAICADPTCASVSLVTLDSGDIFAGRFADLALTAADHPVVVHATTTAITVAVCGDPVCSSVANHIAVPKTGGLELTETSLALTSQNWPVIAFFQEDNSANNNEDVKLAVCFNPICGSVTVTDIDLTGFHAGHTELVLTDEDLARLTYVQQSGDDDVRAVYCNDLICSNPEITAFEAASSSAYASIALDSEDNLAAAYYTGTLQIRLVTCAEEPPCERRTVDAGLSTPAPPVPVALALDAANNAVIVYEMDGQLRLYREVDTLGNADFELGFSPWTLIARGGGDGR